MYREKWGTLAFGVSLGIAFVTFGVGFYYLVAGKDAASLPFLVVLCGVFVLAGIAILVRLPHQARQVIADNGMRVLVANADGITLSRNLGAEPKHFAWHSIAEIVVVERLRLVESDETSYFWRTVVVFLPIDPFAATHWSDRVKSGISLSGTGRPFILGDFPRGQGQAIGAALRRFTPSTVQVRLERRATFDKGASADTYAEA